LGAKVIIAEVDEARGARAAEALAGEFGDGRVCFILTDVGDAASVAVLKTACLERFGKVDAVINNATIAPLGAVAEVPIETWDASYRVNLRGPVLLAQAFLPEMAARGHGSFICVSSTGTAYLGAYETFKSAQVHLAETLDAELAETGVNVLTIGPGFVPTQTASRAAAELAPRMGMTEESFYAMNRHAILTPEEAGTGFALAVLYADRFRGMEISSLQALKAADIRYGAAGEAETGAALDSRGREAALGLCRSVRQTLAEQSAGWRERSLFERQWMLRDFRKNAGMSVEKWLDGLERLAAGLAGEGPVTVLPLEELAAYYDHLAGLARGYEKDPEKLRENLAHIHAWRDEALALAQALGETGR
jgi:NAD(P)-dependent dehydrogenase (short-subunit alcohol dehydrogenase family)